VTIGHPDVPLYSQKVNYEGEDSGFPTDQDIAQWEDNCCGIACLRMVVDYFTGTKVSYWDMLQRALAKNGYVEAGWIHHKLLELGEDFGLKGRTHRRESYEDLLKCTNEGSLCIVSVTVGFWGGRTNPRTGTDFAPGGHLVVAYQNEVGQLAVNHPASHPESNKKNWVVQRDRWEKSLSGNFIEFPHQ
jgi:Peptidase_C39 like family